MSDLIERLRNRIHDSHMDTERMLDEAADEIERLNNTLRWEQNRAERIGTHGLDCHLWGPQHYECLLREYERLRLIEQAARNLMAVNWGQRDWGDAYKRLEEVLRNG